MNDRVISNPYRTLLLGYSFLCLFLFPLYLFPLYFMGTDYSAWGNDALKFTRCISSSIQPCSELSKFPIGYLAISFLIEYLKNHGLKPELSFVLINLIFLSLPIVFLYIIKKSKLAFKTAIIYIACLLLTPIPSFYIYSGALELQAGVLVGLFLSSFILFIQKWYQSKNIYIFIILCFSAILFPLYKDIILIIVVLSLFISLVIFLCLFRKSSITQTIKSALPYKFQILLILLCLSLPLCASIYFNYFKYKSLIPLAYINEASVSSPSKIKSVEFLLASLFSPNGGVLVFWFSSFICCYLLMRLKKQTFSQLSLLVSVFLFAGSVIGLALWWAPFGWDSWGNRLMVPTMLGILITLILTTNTQATQNIAISRQTSKAPINLCVTKHRMLIKWITVILCLWSLHYVFVSYYTDKPKLIRESLLNHPSCLAMMDALRKEGQEQGFAFWRSDYYYICARDRFLHIPSFWKQF